MWAVQIGGGATPILRNSVSTLQIPRTTGIALFGGGIAAVRGTPVTVDINYSAWPLKVNFSMVVPSSAVGPSPSTLLLDYANQVTQRVPTIMVTPTATMPEAVYGIGPVFSDPLLGAASPSPAELLPPDLSAAATQLDGSANALRPEALSLTFSAPTEALASSSAALTGGDIFGGVNSAVSVTGVQGSASDGSGRM